MKRFRFKTKEEIIFILLWIPLLLFTGTHRIFGFNDKGYEKSFLPKEKKFRNYDNKIIRFIHIIISDVSAPSFEGDSTWQPSWFGKIGNSLHYKSRDWVVRDRLLFKEGDILDPRLLEESERILRSIGVFLDARIEVEPLKNSQDSVDISVYTQDRWTLSFLISYNTNAKNGYLGLGDENFLGLGHLLNFKFTHDENKSIGMGGKFRYTAANIAGSFIDGDIKFETDKRSNLTALSFSRPFITTYIPWSGAVDFNWQNDIFLFSRNSNELLDYRYKKVSQDAWLGRTFKFPLFDLFKYSTNIFASASILHVDYPRKPIDPDISQKIFESYTQILFSAGIINRRFYKDNYINSFGVTEDVPIGGQISATLGKDVRNTSNRWYMGAEGIFSKRISGIGYASADLKLGGFKNLGIWEQNIFDFNFIYHTELFRKKNWKYRFFLQTDLLYGLNRFAGEQIYLNSENNFRGLDNVILFGTKRLTINLEGRFFSPFSLLGFVLGGIAFSDFGLISGPISGLSSSKLYQSYGIGIRTKNESITNTNFVISIAYIPINNRTTGGTFKILFNTSVVLGLRDFGLSSPSIFKFGDNQ